MSEIVKMDSKTKAALGKMLPMSRAGKIRIVPDSFAEFEENLRPTFVLRQPTKADEEAILEANRIFVTCETGKDERYNDLQNECANLLEEINNIYDVYTDATYNVSGDDAKEAYKKFHGTVKTEVMGEIFRYFKLLPIEKASLEH